MFQVNWLLREQCFSLLCLAPQLCVYKDLWIPSIQGEGDS